MFPSWQPSLISFNTPIDSGSIIKPCTLKLFQVPILAPGLYISSTCLKSHSRWHSDIAVYSTGTVYSATHCRLESNRRWASSEASSSTWKRFRKSVAEYLFDNQPEYHKNLGWSSGIGPIFSWVVNYDLHIASLNGIKTAHTMGMGFTQHPAGIINADIGVMQLKIPRLKEHEVSTTQLADQGIQLEHHAGLSKRNPPSFSHSPCRQIYHSSNLH